VQLTDAALSIKKHMTGTREEWLAARLELLEAEKELTRRSDELARRRQELPWVRVDKEYRFETDEGGARQSKTGGIVSSIVIPAIESALGQKQTSRHVRVMSVIPLKADIRQREWHVRLVPLADI
jgi:Bacterial protein of unknown function (DUF899)